MSIRGQYFPAGSFPAVHQVRHDHTRRCGVIQPLVRVGFTHTPQHTAVARTSAEACRSQRYVARIQYTSIGGAGVWHGGASLCWVVSSTHLANAMIRAWRCGRRAIDTQVLPCARGTGIVHANIWQIHSSFGDRTGATPLFCWQMMGKQCSARKQGATI